jgi:SH3 domain protein
VVLLLPLLAAAETAYVTDNLRLGLHQAADTSDRAFRTLDSGQELEILSRDRNYAHVSLPDGVQGYVKAAYLVDDKPAKLIVAETQAQANRLARELEEARQEFAAPAATIDALKQQTADLQARLDQSEATTQELGAKNASLRNRQSQYKNSMPLRWVGGAVSVCVAGGFLLGLWWVDHRSRKRHGGIRIY